LVRIHAEGKPVEGEDLRLWSVWMYGRTLFSRQHPDAMPLFTRFFWALRETSPDDLRRRLLRELKIHSSLNYGHYDTVVIDTCLNDTETWKWDGSTATFPLTLYTTKGVEPTFRLEPFCAECNGYFSTRHQVCQNCRKCVGDADLFNPHHVESSGPTYVDGSSPYYYTCTKPGRWMTQQVWVENK
jgi:hypothetical protein